MKKRLCLKVLCSIIVLICGNMTSFAEECTVNYINFNDISPYLNCLTQKVNPQTTIFAFDLHEVLFRRNFRRMAYGGIWMFCKSFFYVLTHPTVIPRMISLSREDIAAEGIYVKLADEYPYLNNFEADVCEIANGCCRPIEPMIDLLKTLKKSGFKVFLLSNLGENTLKDFKRRFNYFEDMFDGFYSPGKCNDYICKPNPSFYKGFKNYLSSLGYVDKQILFVDDLEKNIIGASQIGIAGIHFSGHQNLCEILNKLGIAISKGE